MKLLAVVLIGYLLGSIPAGYLLVRILRGADVRSEGSGNIRATNVLRTTGQIAGLATLLLDAGKGALAVLVAGWTGVEPVELGGAVAMLAAVTGHAFPIALGFRGGKGVATAIGASLLLAPLASLVALVGLVIAVAVSRWVSLGSMVYAIILPIAVLVQRGPWPAFPFLLATSALVVLRHSENIVRLVHGTESRLGSR